MSRKKFKKLEKLDPRTAAEVDKVFKEIEGPELPEDCKYPELWYRCTEDLREMDEEVTLAKVKSSYNKLLKEITEKKASFIGNTIIPELDHLMHTKRVDINDQKKTIEEFKRSGLENVSKYLEMISPGDYKALINLVKTSKKADIISQKWDGMSFSQREKILTGVGYGNQAYQLASNSWNTLPQYVIDSINHRLAQRLAQRKKAQDCRSISVIKKELALHTKERDGLLKELEDAENRLKKEKKAQGGYETCPNCKGTMVVKVPGGDGQYKCPECGLQFKKDKTAQRSFDADLPFDQSGKMVGWIAMYGGQKLEIKKSEANGLWGATQLARQKLKVPKSKQGLMSIEPAYE